MMLSGEQMVKGEQSIVHLAGLSGIKRPAIAGLSGLCRCGFVALRQPVAVAVLPERQVGLRALFGVPLLVVHPVLFQHHRQPQPEHFQTQHVLVAVGLHIHQIGVIEIVTGLSRDDIGVPHKHPVRLRQCFQIAAKIKRRVRVALDAECLVRVLL